MRSVDAILFDLDGTLIDSKRDLANSVHFLQRRYHRKPSSDEQISQFIGDGVVKLVERAIGQRPAGQIRRAVALFKKHYRRHALDHTSVYPGVIDTLEHFRRRKLAVVTNKPVRVSRRILRGLNLMRYFQVVLGGDSVERKKPHPEGPLLALEQLGVSPRRAVMVGDGFQDVMAGRAARMRTIGIRSNIGDWKLLRRSRPTLTVKSVNELVRIIR
jgi:phosphoglycolate phosphatase